MENTTANEDSIMTAQTQVNADGDLIQVWAPAEPLPMVCERKGCSNQNGKDYKRKPQDEIFGWEGEPIFLCDKHSQGYTPIVG